MKIYGKSSLKNRCVMTRNTLLCIKPHPHSSNSLFACRIVRLWRLKTFWKKSFVRHTFHSPAPDVKQNCSVLFGGSSQWISVTHTHTLVLLDGTACSESILSINEWSSTGFCNRRENPGRVWLCQWDSLLLEQVCERDSIEVTQYKRFLTEALRLCCEISMIGYCIPFVHRASSKG